jgi:hypothetical protein
MGQGRGESALARNKTDAILLNQDERRGGGIQEKDDVGQRRDWSRT